MLDKLVEGVNNVLSRRDFYGRSSEKEKDAKDE